MRKWLCFAGVPIYTLLLYGCSNPEQAEVADKWDCTVACAEESTEASYVITYSEEEILSNTGTLTFQNQNDFQITVHLIGEGQEEYTCEIQAGGNVAYLQPAKDVTYKVGIHADVEEGTELKLMVYDGKRSEVF